MCITNWGSFILLQIRGNVVTNWGSYYKLRQNLLRIRQLLQIRTIISNRGITAFSWQISLIISKLFFKSEEKVKISSFYDNYLKISQ